MKVSTRYSDAVYQCDYCGKYFIVVPQKDINSFPVQIGLRYFLSTNALQYLFH